MAMTVTIKENTVFGNKRVVTASVVLDNSYTTGGYTCTASLFGLYSISEVLVEGYPIGAYIYSTNKLLFRNGSGTEIGNGVDLSAATVNCMAIGS